ncbi:unnamed protein product [Didymodactylos carnosus]|nr:unnamed protein product [Didymodactylos carnosus]CAF3917249.1 unnamed protein product [Didymodactylos carnosus]
MDLETGVITRQALNRVGYLGSLYNIRRDEFLGAEIFDSKLPDDVVSTVDCHTQNFHLDHENNYSSTFKHLDVQAELKLSIMGGIIKISGKGNYLSTVNTNDRYECLTCTSSLITKRDKVHISYKGVQKCICKEAFSDPRATHVVTEIVWGANVIAKFEQKKTGKNDLQKIGGQLEGAMNIGPGIGAMNTGSGIEGKADVEVEDKSNNVKDKFSITFVGDVQMNIIPATVADVATVLKGIPDKIKQMNGGKGVQLSFVLTPIKEVARYVSAVLPSAFEMVTVRQTNEMLVKRIEKTFDYL